MPANMTLGTASVGARWLYRVPALRCSVESSSLGKGALAVVGTRVVTQQVLATSEPVTVALRCTAAELNRTLRRTFVLQPAAPYPPDVALTLTGRCATGGCGVLVRRAWACLVGTELLQLLKLGLWRGPFSVVMLVTELGLHIILRSC